MLSPQRADRAQKQATADKVKFNLLMDANNEVGKAFVGNRCGMRQDGNLVTELCLEPSRLAALCVDYSIVDLAARSCELNLKRSLGRGC